VGEIIITVLRLIQPIPYGRYNEINVSGAGFLLSVGGNLDISSGWNATDNYLRLTDNYIAACEWSGWFRCFSTQKTNLIFL
jgi:hypothetical protein